MYNTKSLCHDNINMQVAIINYIDVNFVTFLEYLIKKKIWLLKKGFICINKIKKNMSRDVLESSKIALDSSCCIHTKLHGVSALVECSILVSHLYYTRHTTFHDTTLMSMIKLWFSTTTA